MNNDSYEIRVIDICGLSTFYKKLSSDFYSFLYNRVEQKDAKRLLAKLASDKYEQYTKYKNYYLNKFSSIKKDLKTDLLIFYPLIIENSFIPLDNHRWTYYIKNISRYVDVYDLYVKNANYFCKLLNSLSDKCNDNEGKKLVKIFLSKEFDYKNSIDQIFEQLKN